MVVSVPHGSAWPNAPSGNKQLGLWRIAKSKAEVAAFFREQAARKSWPGEMRTTEVSPCGAQQPREH